MQTAAASAPSSALHHRHQKRTDSFLRFADADISHPDQASPGNGAGSETSHSDSLLMDVRNVLLAKPAYVTLT